MIMNTIVQNPRREYKSHLFVAMIQHGFTITFEVNSNSIVP